MPRALAFRSLAAASLAAALALGASASAFAAEADSGEISSVSADPPPPPGPPETSDSLTFSAPPEPPRDSAASDPSMNQHSQPVARIHAGLGLQWFWVADKAVSGLMLRAGQGLWSGAFEASLVFDTSGQSGDSQRDVHHAEFLGAQFGGYAMASPIHSRRFELGLGLGLDYYRLWGIHASQWELALSGRADAHLRVVSNFGVFASMRVYPLSTSGLELGTYRDRERGLPVLFSTGIEWTLQ